MVSPLRRLCPRRQRNELPLRSPFPRTFPLRTLKYENIGTSFTTRIPAHVGRPIRSESKRAPFGSCVSWLSSSSPSWHIRNCADGGRHSFPIPPDSYAAAPTVVCSFLPKDLIRYDGRFDSWINFSVSEINRTIFLFSSSILPRNKAESPSLLHVSTWG